ncbi:MAG: hypothetical protein RJA14_155, partial [Pseudomonadota bacterium]
MCVVLDAGVTAFYDANTNAGLRPATKLGWTSNVLGRIFGWTSGATIGTFFTIAKRGEHVGTDEFGNRYYLSR